MRATADVDRRIPELKEVFERFPTIPVNIDIKYDSDKLISEVKRMFEMYHSPSEKPCFYKLCIKYIKLFSGFCVILDRRIQIC